MIYFYRSKSQNYTILYTILNNIQVNVHKTVKYGNKTLRTFGPHIWNSLPGNMKAETNLIKFREYINQWFEPICKCNLCVYT